MNASELINYLSRRQIDSLFRAARSLPQDRLDWKPAPGARSALDQLQEAATGVSQFWSVITTGTMEGGPESFAKWQEERAKLTSLDELEQRTREETDRLAEYISSLSEAQLAEPITLPWPGEHKKADVAAYHLWNMSYHEGQINYIASLLDTPEQA
jgi:uncharacterized damage-inducible protein DinB